MSAFMGNPHVSQSDMMENYMKFCMQQQQQQIHGKDVNMFEQFQFMNNNNSHNTQQQHQQQQATNDSQQQYNNIRLPNHNMHQEYTNQQLHPSQSQMFMNQMNNKYDQTKETSTELPLFEQFMKQQINKQAQHSFIPFDIDNFNGDGLQKGFDLAYQNESKILADM